MEMTDTGEIWFCKDCDSKFSKKPLKCICGGTNILMYAVSEEKLLYIGNLEEIGKQR